MSNYLFKMLTGLIIVFSSTNFIMKKENNKNKFSDLFKVTKTDSLWVESTLANMSLKEKCAQMIMSYVNSKDTNFASEEFRKLKNLVGNVKVGGLVFFEGNYRSQAKLTNKLQAMAEVPLLISSDYERGLGMRLKDAVEFPYNMAIDAARDTNLTYLSAEVTALESGALGVEQNFAPLVDINNDAKNPIINIRAFSDDPSDVSENAAAYIDGMNRYKIISTAKHFPGHGATQIDSHRELPVISLTKKQLEKSDLIPFEQSIKAGVKAAIESKKGLPATFSKKIVTDLLQNQLGFKGLIVTDALNMHAVSDHYTPGQAAVKAVEAGNDILLFPEDDIAAVEGLYNAVKKGEISVARINYSVRKILTAKSWVGLNKKRKINISKLSELIHKKSHWRLAEEIADKSITLLKDSLKLIPVNVDNYNTTVSISLADFDYNKNENENLLFNKYARENFNYIRTHKLFLNSSKKSFEEAYKSAESSNLILLPIYLTVRASQGTIQLDKKYVEFINKILSLKIPTIAISFGSPYIINQLPKLSTYICTFSPVKASQKSLMNALLGNIKITGKLPVTIAGTKFKRGYGLYRDSKGLFFEKTDPDTLYNFSKVDSIMRKGIADSVFPGAELLIGFHGRVIFNKAFGHQTYKKSSPKITTQTLFDLASLTKVIGTTSAAMILYDEGKLKLDERVIDYLPEFNNNGKQNVTIRNLLLHNSGLPAYKRFYKKYTTAKQVINDIMHSKLKFKPGARYLYSDLGMIVLQKVIEKISGEPLNVFLKKNVFQPLGMNRTMFNPPPTLWYYCAPTEIDNYWRMTTMQGKVHDETAYLLNGVSGNAGLFSTTSDIAKLIYTLLNKGVYDGKRLFKASTVKNWTTKQTNQSSRALGWDTKSPKHSSAGTKFSMNTFGHLGFTGTSVWADKDNGLFVVLLTNRVYPTRKNIKIRRFRPVIHNAVYDAVTYHF